jgi:hypothetical protein
MLPPGTRDIASDEAIALAADVRLGDARAAWNEDGIDFVDQVDYQLAFRSQADYLSATPDHLNEVLTAKQRNVGIDELLLYLTDEEATEFQRRLNVGDLMPAIATAVTGMTIDLVEEGVEPDYGENFIGIWMDQFDGGRIVLAVRDPRELNLESIARIVPLNQIKIIHDAPTLQEIDQRRMAIRTVLRDLGIDVGFTVESTGDGRFLHVVVKSPDELPIDVMGILSEAWIVVDRGTPGFRESGSPASLHSFADQHPGLGIGVHTPWGGWGCTWGLNGRTEALFYLITAGHCLEGLYANHFGSTVNTFVYQADNVNRSIAEPSPWVGSRHSIAGSDYHDFARIESTYANDNCYHSPSGECYWYTTHRASGNSSWEINSDTTCASLGKSNTYRCGQIKEENLEGYDGLTRADIATLGGDSGAGMKYSSYIDGIAVSIHNPTGDVAFISAFEATVNFGSQSFSFLCYNGQKTGGTVFSWPACPTVDR